MKKKIMWGIIFCMAVIVMFGLRTVTGAELATTAADFKLPFSKGERFIVVQGYNAPPTHVKKDLYALDFSQNDCEAYGKSAIAASSGKVMLVQENGYNGGYGTQLLIDHGNNIFTRYAHLLPETIPFVPGESVVQGQAVGEIGDTGLVAGFACAIHPGTHLHFVAYEKNADGSFVAYLAEPISNYTNIAENKWYVSDNELAGEPAPIVTPLLVNNDAQKPTSSQMQVQVKEAIGMAAPSATVASGDTLGIPGSVSMTPPSIVTTPIVATSTSPVTVTSTLPAIATIPTSSIIFNSSTLAIDLAWQPMQNTSGNASGSVVYQVFKNDPTNASNTVLVATTTDTHFSYPVEEDDYSGNQSLMVEADDEQGNISTVALASTTLPNWFAAIQPVADQNSNGSWYEDNWYNLGTGFYGTIRTLNLEGFIDNSDYFQSQLWLDEYLDPAYSHLNQTFVLSLDAPFTNGLKKVSLTNLNVPLQPNKYYRLRTFQTYQNRSVILAGTNATGTAMWNQFISGTGRVEQHYSFYPYISAVMIPNYPPLARPDPPASISATFDSLNSVLRFSWPQATDSDTTSSLLTYEVNVSTSTSFNAEQWQSVGNSFATSTSVIFGNSYMIGVRTVDDLGNISDPQSQSWNFPSGYFPAPQQLDHAAQLPGGAQKIVLFAPTVISGVALWTVSDINGAFCCGQSFISIHFNINNDEIGPQIAASVPVSIGQRWDPREEMYTFDPPIALIPGVYWFEVDSGPSPSTDATYIFGSGGDAYPEGKWSTVQNQDAYFRIQTQE